MMLPSAIIVDLDGTLTSCEHRRKFVINGNKNWRDFNYNIPFDAPVPWVRNIVWNAWRDDCTVLFTSGRSNDNRRETSLWLLDQVLTPFTEKWGWKIDYMLFMRDSGDYRSDAIVKEEIFHRDIEPFFDVEFVVDDRWPVIQMWESLGLFVIRATDPGLEPLV